MKYIFQLLLFAFTLSNCTKNIDIKYPEGGGRLTLNCVLSPGDSVFANLTSTLPYEQVALSPQYKDALISLMENGKVVDTLKICKSIYRPEASDTVWTYCSAYPVKTGSTYTLKAFRPGFPEVSGSTVIPPGGKIKKIVNSDVETYGETFDITLEDPGPEDNYFILQIQYKGPRGENSYATLLTEDPTIGLYSSGGGIIKDPTQAEQGDMAFFTDEYFVNGGKTISLRATFNSDDKANRIILHSVSKSYYEYVRSLQINQAVSENPFSEPIRVKSNVEGGFGLVGGINVTEINF